MTSVEPYRSSLTRWGSTGAVDRAVARIEAIGTVRLARLEVEAEVQAAAVDAVSYVGRRAMHDVALLSQVEQQLAQAVPLATSRLEAIGNMAALAMSNVVAETACRLRRV
jgi:hypothetical protein